jgi:hypothetical protein
MYYYMLLYCCRIYRPSFHENKPKTLVFAKTGSMNLSTGLFWFCTACGCTNQCILGCTLPACSRILYCTPLFGCTNLSFWHMLSGAYLILLFFSIIDLYFACTGLAMFVQIYGVIYPQSKIIDNDSSSRIDYPSLPRFILINKIKSCCVMH